MPPRRQQQATVREPARAIPPGDLDRQSGICRQLAETEVKLRVAFARVAGDAEKNCPVSKVLNAQITLDAKLI